MQHDETPKSAPDSEAGESSGLVLHNLIQAGNLDRLESVAKQYLSRDPEDTTAHYYLTLALIDLERPEEAKQHLDFLLASDPESVRTQIAALCYYGNRAQWPQLRRHIAEGLRLNPDLAFFHRYAAVADLQGMKLKGARQHIAHARELDPDDADIAHLYIHIHSVGETSAADALERLEEFRAALRLDPQNAALHDSMGGVYLVDLDSPSEAERHFREALRMEPRNRDYQRNLFQAVAKRSLTYRLFSLPSRTYTWLGLVAHGIALQPWRLLFLLIGIKAVAGFFFWLGLVTVLFWPGGKVYEWLLVSEIKCGSAASNAELRAWFWFRRWPRWVRFAAFLMVNLALWGGLFAALNFPLTVGYAFVAAVIVIHLIFVSVAWGIRRATATSAERKAGRRDSEVPQTL